MEMASKKAKTAKHRTDVKKNSKGQVEAKDEVKKASSSTKPDIFEETTKSGGGAIQTARIVMMTMKRITSVMVMMAMAIVCMTSFTACGGDDDDLHATPVNGNEAENVDFDLMAPCLNWGASSEQVKNYMKGSNIGLSLDEDVLLYYSNEKNEVLYYFNASTGLYGASVTYLWYSDKDFKAVKAQTEKMYGVKLEEYYNKTSGLLEGYVGTTTINGRESGIMCAFSKEAQSFGVHFGLVME